MINFRFNLKYKILVLILLLITILILTLLPLILSNTRKIMFSNLIKRGETLTKNFALSSESLLLTSDELALEDLVDVIMHEKDVICAYIVSKKDLTYFLHSNRNLLGKKYKLPENAKIIYKKNYNIIIKNKNNIIYQFFTPVRKLSFGKGTSEIFGTAYIEISTYDILKRLNKLKFNIILLFLAVFGLGVIGTFFLSSFIVKPINILKNGLDIVGSGNLNYKISISTKDEIELLANNFNKMTAKLYRLQKEMVKKKLYEYELKLAKSIQRDVIIEKAVSIPNYDLSIIYNPIRDVGGDYYSIIDINSYLKGLIIADVSGKGVPAALLMAIFHTIINIFSNLSYNLEEFVKKITENVFKYLKKGNFITAIFGLLDINSNKFKFISAGHEPPIFYQINKKIFQIIKTKGIPIGIMDLNHFFSEISVNEIKFNKNDLLLLYTDGIRTMSKKTFDNKKLLNFFENLINSEKSNIESFGQLLNNEISKRKFSDDVTIISLRRIK